MQLKLKKKIRRNKNNASNQNKKGAVNYIRTQYNKEIKCRREVSALNNQYQLQHFCPINQSITGHSIIQLILLGEPFISFPKREEEYQGQGKYALSYLFEFRETIRPMQREQNSLSASF